MLTLHIGNKNYSSWSLRPWLAMREAAIAFEEVRLRLSFTAGSPFKLALAAIAPSGKVPVLVDDDVRGADGRPLAVWDTLAIAEYLAEKFPGRGGLWPDGVPDRARARSLCAEMHSGFGALRTHMPMNIEASLPAVGATLLRERADVRADVERIAALWSGQLAASGGPFLFGAFGLADAYFAPVCTRLRTYGVAVPEPAAAYAARVLAVPSMLAWERDARAEADFLDFDEPYRTRRDAV